VTLAVVLVAVSPRALVKLGIVAMAAVDVWLVVSDLLAAPNGALNAAAPVAHLPQLQRVVFGSAVMGYGDIFIAALLGALLAATPRLVWRAVAIAAAIGLAGDLLFLVVDELPATVPIALTLVVLELVALRARRRVEAAGGSDSAPA
jgi:prepilin signal peptidase PulO-like enzyme (type II secretory pathway)